MSREKIINLARHCNQESIRATKNRPYGIYELTEEALVAFYHAAIADFLQTSSQYVTNDASREACIKQAKAEAFEEAAKCCGETREIEDHWDGGTTTVHKHFYRDDCIAAIREMAKEMK